MDDAMTQEEQTSPAAPTSGDGQEPDSRQLDGRGLRMLVLGALVTVLAPLAGFLGGSIVGESQDHRIDPLAIWLFGGLVVGGIGAVIAFVGGLRWVQANRGRL